MKKTLTLAAVVALAGAASAQIESTPDLAVGFGGPIPSLAGAGFTGTTPQATYTFSNSFTLGNIGWDGFADVLAAGTWGSELNVQFYLNGATFGFAQIGTGNASYPSGTNFAGTAAGFYSGMAITAGDVFGFEFLESYDDGGDDLADAEWSSISFDFFEFVTPPTLADLAIGTINGTGMVSGDTTGSSDDTQGGTGNPFGAGSNTGGDDVYELIWGGGDIEITLDILDGTQDLDVFLYDDASPASALASGFTIGNPEVISEAGLPAGTYYIRVDGFNGDASAYNLTVTPAPGAMALMGLAGLAGFRRRRA